jgi:hypothetical protein
VFGNHIFAQRIDQGGQIGAHAAVAHKCRKRRRKISVPSTHNAHDDAESEIGFDDAGEVLDKGQAVLAAAAQNQLFLELSQEIFVRAGAVARAIQIRALGIVLDYIRLDDLNQKIVVMRMLINVAIGAGNQRASAL